MFKEIIFREKKNFPIVRILIGVPCTGKSTYAANLINNNDKWVRINRDDLRFMMLGKAFGDSKSEEIITQIEQRCILSSVNRKKNVIVDKTHLRWEYIQDIISLVKGKAGIEFVVFDLIDKDLAMKRMIDRGREIPNDVYTKQCSQFKSLLPRLESLTPIPIKYDEEINHIPYNYDLPDCILVDLDGTLAWRKDRHPFEFNRVDEDGVHEHVRRIIQDLIIGNNKNLELIILSARSETCQELSTNWLYRRCGITPSRVLLRKEGDFRPGPVAKKELYEKHILGKYNVLGIFEDDSRVVRMWREEFKLPVFWVNPLDND